MIPASNLAHPPQTHTHAHHTHTHTHTHTNTLRQKIHVFPVMPCSFGSTPGFLWAHSLDYCLTCQQWEADLLHNSSPDFWRLQFSEMNINVVSMWTCLVIQLSSTLCNPWITARQAPLSMGFSRQEYWSGLPCPSPGDLPNQGIKPRSPELQRILYHLSYQGRPTVSMWSESCSVMSSTFHGL